MPALALLYRGLAVILAALPGSYKIVLVDATRRESWLWWTGAE